MTPKMSSVHFHAVLIASNLQSNHINFYIIFISYTNAFVADKEAADDFGSAFADTPDSDSNSNSNSFESRSDPYLHPSTTSTTTAAGPRVNFDAMGSINTGTVAPIYGIYNGPGNTNTNGNGIDYVFSDDYMDIRRKSFGEQLQYLCGAAFLSGGFLGGAYGTYEGMKQSAGKSTKLRLNAVLNGAAKRGIAASNGLAVVALFFTFSESALYGYLNDDTAVNYALAGAATGALYKSTKGLRAAGMSGAGGAAIALATVYMARQGNYGRGLQGLL